MSNPARAARPAARIHQAASPPATTITPTSSTNRLRAEVTVPTAVTLYGHAVSQAVEYADCASSAKWQETVWPDASSRSSGTSVLHLSSARRQRVWKRQPDGGDTGDGGSPASTIRCRP